MTNRKAIISLLFRLIIYYIFTTYIKLYNVFSRTRPERTEIEFNDRTELSRRRRDTARRYIYILFIVVVRNSDGGSRTVRHFGSRWVGAGGAKAATVGLGGGKLIEKNARKWKLRFTRRKHLRENYFCYCVFFSPRPPVFACRHLYRLVLFDFFLSNPPSLGSGHVYVVYR